MNGKWSKENFELHHKANPDIYQMFEEYAIQAPKYRSKYSAKIIFHMWMIAVIGKETQICLAFSKHV